MRRPASYPKPGYSDPRDRRLVSIIRSSDRAEAGAVNILGVPFEGGVLGRKGAAGGPSAIRNAMRYFSNFSPELSLDLRDAAIVDLGDVATDAGDVNEVHAEVEKEVAAALLPSSLLIVVGGDNSISLPSIRACSEDRKLGVVVFDSHFDLREPMEGKPTSGSSYGIALRTIGSLSGSRFVEVGIHGFLNSREYADEAHRLGLTVFTAKDVRRIGALESAKRAYGIAARRADGVYVSVDLDCLDISHMLGVSAPSAGGLGASELFDMLYFLGSRKNVLCSDIVELAPQLDQSGRSDVVAATALLHLAAGFVARDGRKNEAK